MPRAGFDVQHNCPETYSCRGATNALSRFDQVVPHDLKPPGLVAPRKGASEHRLLVHLASIGCDIAEEPTAVALM